MNCISFNLLGGKPPTAPFLLKGEIPPKPCAPKLGGEQLSIFYRGYYLSLFCATFCQAIHRMGM